MILLHSTSLPKIPQVSIRKTRQNNKTPAPFSKPKSPLVRRKKTQNNKNPITQKTQFGGKFYNLTSILTATKNKINLTLNVFWKQQVKMQTMKNARSFCKQNTEWKIQQLYRPINKFHYLHFFYWILGLQLKLKPWAIIN